MPESKLQGKSLGQAMFDVAKKGEDFAASVRAMHSAGASVEMLRALLPGLTAAAVEDMLHDDLPAKSTPKKAKAKK